MRAHRHTMASGGIRLLAGHSSKLRTVIVPILVVAALTFGAPRADATPLAAGGIVPALGINFPGGTELDSVFYEDIGLANLVVDVASAVFRSAGGTLDFYYQVENDSALNQVHRLTASSFAGFITEVWFVINGATVPCTACPGGFLQNGTQAPLTIDRDVSGEVVGFNFPTGLEVDPGEASLVLLIQTNETSFRPGFVSVINSGTVTESAFEPGGTVPPTYVPEPASLMLFGIGLLGIGAAMWRKRNA